MKRIKKWIEKRIEWRERMLSCTDKKYIRNMLEKEGTHKEYYEYGLLMGLKDALDVVKEYER